MSIFSRLFGGGGGGGDKAASNEPTEVYKDYRIFAQPEKASGGYRVGARIEKDVDGEMKSHSLIRADTLSNLDEAQVVSVSKAKQMIDEQGDGVFS